MNAPDITKTRQLLADYCNHFDLLGGPSGVYIAAHWFVGGMTQFRSLDHVHKWLREKKRRDARPPIGARIRAARRDAGISQVELARRSGIHQSRLSRIENENFVCVYSTTVERIADALGISPRDLFVD